MRGEVMITERLYLAAVCGLVMTLSPYTAVCAQEATVPAGVPLRIEIDHGYRLRIGTPVKGHLIDPVYVGSSLAVPTDAAVSGRIIGTHPVAKSERVNALLDGDFTPLQDAVIEFDTLAMPGHDALPIATHVTERTAALVHLDSTKKPTSLIGKVREQVHQHREEYTKQVTGPNKMDRLRRFVYGQLPYHPQEVWAGTQFDAELTQPLDVTRVAPPLPPAPDEETKLAGKLEARLTTDLNSAVTKQGTVVYAISTKPLLDASAHHVLLPEGTQLTGTVLQAKPAKSFGRNGALRFSFRRIAPPGEGDQQMHGQLTAAEGAKDQNLSIDSEGAVKANPDKNRFIAPLILGVLATKSLDNDGSTAVQGAVVSNGFGLVARVIGLASGNTQVSAGFAYYGFAKSIYRRWIARGHEVKFGRNTLLEVELSPR